MQVTFTLVPPKGVQALPLEARLYLDAAAKASPANDITSTDALADAASGYALLYLIEHGGILYGAACLVFAQGDRGKILNVSLLGGRDFGRWGKQFHDFVIRLAQATECASVLLMGRKGWGRIFPHLKPIGVIYAYDVLGGALH